MPIRRNLGIEIWLSEQNTALIIDYPLLLYSKTGFKEARWRCIPKTKMIGIYLKVMKYVME